MKDWPPYYSYLEEAAAEARKASRRYWAKGGYADRKYPVADDIGRMWPFNGDVPEDSTPKRKEGRKWFSKPKPGPEDG